MSDIEENAFQIARYMRDKNFTGPRTVNVDKVREAVNLSLEEFDAADDYLREMGIYDPMSSEVALKASGIDFVSRKTKERIDISRDAEQLARYLSVKQTVNKTFVVDTEIMTDLQWDGKKYWQAGQVLVDEGLAEVKPKADNVPFKGLSLNAEGRKVVRHNFRRQSAINIHAGDDISIENSGPNAVIAAGSGNNVTQIITSPQIGLLFDEINRQIEQRQDLSFDKKQAIKDVVDLAQDEAKQKEPNQKRLAAYFQNIALMAPDILDVSIAAASTPIVGPLPVLIMIAKKVSEKAKAEANKNEAG